MRTAIERTKVLSGEHVHDRLFELARRLKAIRGLRFTPDFLRLVAETWNGAGQVQLTGKARERLPGRLAKCLGLVKKPKGLVMRQVLDAARRMPPPACARWYYGKPKLVLLVTLCAVLEAYSCGEPWHLSGRTVGELLGLSYEHARRLLKRLHEDGVLLLVEKGAQGTVKRRASTWRFIGGHGQESES